MIALHLKTKKKLEFWQVEKVDEMPAWAEQAFSTGAFRWNGQRLLIQNVGGLLKMSVSVKDVLVFNGKYLKVVPERKFKSDYRVL